MLVCRIYSRQFTPAKLLHLFRERIHFIMSIGFGTTKDGKEALLYTISNQNGMSAEISNYGCAIVSLKVPAKDGKTLDVVLGYDNVSGYEDNPQCFGCCIGRIGRVVRGIALFCWSDRPARRTKTMPQSVAVGIDSFATARQYSASVR